VVNREIFDPMVGTPGTIIPPESWESGYKDTVIVYPGQLTRIKARFDFSGLFVWHCHILEHEDNEMMRPYEILAAPIVVNGTIQVCKQNTTGTFLPGWDFTADGVTQTTDGTGVRSLTSRRAPTRLPNAGPQPTSLLTRDHGDDGHAAQPLFVNQNRCITHIEVCKENTATRLGWITLMA
jgi:hypothetical protein